MLTSTTATIRTTSVMTITTTTTVMEHLIDTVFLKVGRFPADGSITVRRLRWTPGGAHLRV
eukprot:5178917-Pyramimonas_sp.AAC.2